MAEDVAKDTGHGSASRLLYEGPMHPDLEDCLIERLRTIKERDPLGPATVVVGSALVANYLTQLAAVRGVKGFNLRFVTLPEVARELVARARGPGVSERSFLPTLPPQSQQLAVSHAIRRTMSGGYFARVADRPGFAAVVNETIGDLEQAGLLPEELESRLSARDRDLRDGLPRLNGLLNCYREYRAIVTGRFRTRLDLFTEAARLASVFEEVFGRHLTVYGFYELTGLQKRLLEAVVGAARTAAIAVMVPTDLVAAEAGQRGYSDSLAEWWEARGFTRISLARGASRLRPREGVEVRMLSAPGEAREAREIARLIRGLLRDRRVRPADVGVLVRDRSVYPRLLHEALDAAGISHFLSEGLPLGQTRTGRALTLLFLAVRTALGGGARAGRLRAEELIAFLPNPSPGDAPGPSPSPVERALDRLPRQAAWADMVSALLGLAHDLGLDAWGVADGWPECREALESLAGHDRLGLGAVTLDEFLSAAGDALARGQVDVGRLGSGVSVCDLMSARGLSFEVVFVPGLVEKVFPAQPRPDPILTDAEREALGGLPLARERTAEEAMLFGLALGAARRLLVLSFPRVEPQSARERVPSYFLLLAARGITGRSVDYRSLPNVPGFVRVPLSVLEVADPADAVDPVELDASLVREVLPPGGVSPKELASELSSGTFSSRPWAFLESACPWFRRACRAEASRWGTPWLTVYDGLLADRGVRLAAAERARAEGGGPWAVTALEDYARCPYRFLMARVLGLKAATEPDELGSLTGADRGTVVHQVAARVFREALARFNAGERSLLPPHPGNVERWLRMLGRVIEEVVSEALPQGVAGSLLGAAEKKALAADLAAWIVEEARGWPEGLMPVMVEAEFGRSGPRVACAAELGGRIDRVDATPDRTRFRVVDYKSGKVATDRTLGPLQGGTRLQAPVYMLAASEAFGLGRIEQSEGVYVHIPRAWGRAGSRPPATVTLAGAQWRELAEELSEVIGCILGGLDAGLFVPYPGRDGRNCSWCDFDDVCEPGRDILFAMKANSPSEAMRRFVALKGLGLPDDAAADDPAPVDAGIAQPDREEG